MTLLLTANARLSRALKQQALLDSQQTVAETPVVMTWAQYWQHWQQSLLLGGHLDSPPKPVISAFEAEQVWQTILESQLALGLLNPQETAQQLYQAWCLWQAHRLDEESLAQPGPDLPTAQLGLDSQEWTGFVACAQAYQAWLDQHGLTDEPGIMRQRLAWFAQGLGPCPSRVEWHGFDQRTPLMRQWVRLSQARGCEHQWVGVACDTDSDATPQVRGVAAGDVREECQYAAQFCVQQVLAALDQGRSLAEIQVGVVAPDLEAVKPVLTRWLDDALYQAFSDHPFVAQNTTDRLYNLSLGQPLAQYPYVAMMQQTLWMAAHPDQPMTLQAWRDWLLFPEQMGPRAARHTLDHRLLQTGLGEIVWPKVLAKADGWSLPQPLVQGLRHLKASPPPKACDLSTFVDWVKTLWQGVSALQPSLSSDLYQQRQKLGECLQRFAQMHGLQGKHAPEHWLSQWRVFCEQTPFQAESTWVQPIQVMGMLEAGGARLDALWVMGLDDQAWPRPAKPNAFLPLAWQIQRECPRAHAQHESVYAAQVTQRLCASAPEVVLSYARWQGEAENSPSPLWQAYTQHNIDAANPSIQPVPLCLAHERAWQRRAPLVWVEDNQGPPVPLGEGVPGGTGILSAQRQCPLAAFLAYRLGAQYGLATLESGLTSRDQGRILHRVLQQFWQAVSTQSQLLQMTESDIEAALETALTTAMDELSVDVAPHALAQEHARLGVLLKDWLSLEKARPQAFRVLACEQKMQLTLAGMVFDLTIDRIDQVASGQLLIDYKTGKASAKDLLQVPVKAPQLAVYLFAIDPPVAGLGYGVLHADQGPSWQLITQAADKEAALTATGSQTWDKISAKGAWDEVDWPEFVESLKADVLTLAEAIQQGDAAMQWQDETALSYSSAYLALRWPEAQAQWQAFLNHVAQRTPQ